jgi:hypothetical protein
MAYVNAKRGYEPKIKQCFPEKKGLMIGKHSTLEK